MKLVGIDPGKEGCFASLDTETREISFRDMPLMPIKNKDRVDYWELDKIVKSFAKCHLIVEQLWGFGAAIGHSGGTWPQGSDYGAIIMAIISNKIPHTLVTPQKWQRAVGSQVGKSGSILRAFQLYPGIDLKKSPKHTTYADGRAEALLLAHYGLQLYLKGEIVSV